MGTTASPFLSSIPADWSVFSPGMRVILSPPAADR
jgi:hypothetical protein